MTVYPDFYDAFSCTASACRHTCCRGWAIEIDADTASRYRTLPGPLGERLREHIDWTDLGAAANAGVKACFCTYGYGSKRDYAVDVEIASFRELEKILLTTEQA